MKATLSNGVEIAANPRGAILWASDWATLVLDAIAGKLDSEVRAVDCGPATYGHTDYFYIPAEEVA